MPIDPARYPADWPDISARIRARDGNRCKNCGVAQGAVGWRDRRGELHTDAPAKAGVKIIRVRLTVAHLNHDTTDNRDENLAALCQRCHLRHDRRQHARNAALTRRRYKRLAGQLELKGLFAES